MFSDTLSDTYAKILRDVRPDYAYPNIYDRAAVIDMLASINYVRLLSDARGPDGKLFKPKKDLLWDATEQAYKDYTKRMD